MLNSDTDVNHLKDNSEDSSSPPSLSSPAAASCIPQVLETKPTSSSSLSFLSLLYSCKKGEGIVKPDPTPSSLTEIPEERYESSLRLLQALNERVTISSLIANTLRSGHSHAVDCSATATNVNVPYSRQDLYVLRTLIKDASNPSLRKPKTSHSKTSLLKTFFAGVKNSKSNPACSSTSRGENFHIENASKLERLSVTVSKIKGYLFPTVFCSDQDSVGESYKSSLATTRNSHIQSSTSTQPFVQGAPACASGIVRRAEEEQELSKMKEEMQLEFILKSLVAGGVAGMCAKTTVAPLDRMKILLQAHSKHYSHLGVFSGLRGIVQKERFIALYKGNGAQMVRIFPYAATQFTSFEMYKRCFGEDSHTARFAAGSAAGVTAVALTYPLDTIRARLAFQVTGEHVYNGIYSCALHIFREEGGVKALYRGFTPTVCGMIPYAGLSFYCFESFKYLCMKYLPHYTCKSHSTNTGGLVLLLYAKLICGGIAGAAAQTVSYPLDVTRRRMQLAMMNEHTKKFGMGMISTIKLIYQENGVYKGLYRGMSINYLRAIPMVAVSFSTYELVKQMLSLDTGLPIKTG